MLPFNFTDIPEPDQIVGAGRPPVASQHPMGETGGLQRDVLHARRQRRPDLAADRLLEHGHRRASSARSSARSPGFVGGITDNLLMRVVDVMLSLPILFVILVAAKFLGNGTVVDW